MSCQCQLAVPSRGPVGSHDCVGICAFGHGSVQLELGTRSLAVFALDLAKLHGLMDDEQWMAIRNTKAENARPNEAAPAKREADRAHEGANRGTRGCQRCPATTGGGGWWAVVGSGPALPSHARPQLPTRPPWSLKRAVVMQVANAPTHISISAWCVPDTRH